MDAKELLQKRKQLKRKKPSFNKQDAHKKKKLSSNWRKPRGSDSKMRVSRKGYRRIVKIGWGSPSAVRGLHGSGLNPVIVENKAQLDKLSPGTDVMVISSTVGAKKRLELIELALSKKIQVINYKDAAGFVKKAKDDLEQKKKDKEKLKEERAKKKEAAKKEAEKQKAKEEEKKKTEKKADKEEEMTEEEKKIEDKKEKDKLLISTQ